MPRIRSIKPEFWNDSKMALTCSRDARLLFISLWNFADDRGRAKAHPAVVKAQAFPFDDVTRDDVNGWLGELEAGGFIRRYEVAGEAFLDIRTFKKHQKIENPSRYNYHPEPPKDLWSLTESSPSPHRVLTESSPPDQEGDIGSRIKDQEETFPAQKAALADSTDSTGSAEAPPVVGAPPPLKLQVQRAEPPARKPSWQQELWTQMQASLVGRPGVDVVDPGPPVAELNTRLKQASEKFGREWLLPAWDAWCESDHARGLDPPFAVHVFLQRNVLNRYVAQARREAGKTEAQEEALPGAPGTGGSNGE